MIRGPYNSMVFEGHQALHVENESNAKMSSVKLKIIAVRIQLNRK